MRASLSVTLLMLLLGTAESSVTYAAGAVAYSQDTLYGGFAYGTSHDYNSQEEANGSALESCRRQEHGYNCAIVSRFANACAALSVQEGDNGWAVEIENSINAARRKSWIACSRYGKACSVRAAFCDGTANAPVITQAPPVPATRECEHNKDYNPENVRTACAVTCAGLPDLRGVGFYNICMGARDAIDSYCYALVVDMCTKNCELDGGIGNHHFCNGQAHFR
jgi:Domain of unknown function (DUF4189)